MPADDPTRDRELFAVFREETSTGVNDPYQSADPLPARWKGKQLAVPIQPSGKGKDAMIDKTTPLRVPGDTYIDPFMVDKILTKGLGKPITDKPFKPSNPASKSSGQGSMYGLIAAPILDTAPSATAQSSSMQKSRAPGKRNIYVNPAKSGTYGFPWHDRTIGQTHLEYMPDEYAPGQKLDRALKAEARAKIPKPFISTGRTGNAITPLSNYSGGADEVRSPSSGASKLHPKLWKPANPPQKGPGYGCINRLEYVPCSTVKSPPAQHVKGFVPPGNLHERLSMRTINPYAYEARQQPDNDLSLLG